MSAGEHWHRHMSNNAHDTHLYVHVLNVFDATYWESLAYICTCINTRTHTQPHMHMLSSILEHLHTKPLSLLSHIYPIRFVLLRAASLRLSTAETTASYYHHQDARDNKPQKQVDVYVRRIGRCSAHMCDDACGGVCSAVLVLSV